MVKKKTLRKKTVRKKTVGKSTAKKSTARKTAAKKTAAKKTAAKKTAAKKTAAKKTAAKKTAAKKTAAKKTTAKKTTAKKTIAKKTTAKKTTAKKTTARKSAARKSAARKSAAKKTAAKKTATRKSVLKISEDIKQFERSPASHRRQMPRGYNEDTIVIMPVNADTGFIYWEITEKLLGKIKNKSHGKHERLIIKVFEEDTRKEVCSFDVSEKLGRHYMRSWRTSKPLVAEIGFLEGKKFKSLLRSNPLAVTGSSGKKIDHDVWMQRIKDSFKIIRPPADGTFSEPWVKWLFMKYYREAAKLSGGSLFGSMFFPFI